MFSAKKKYKTLPLPDHIETNIQKIFQFLTDKNLWGNHTSNKAMSGLPLGVEAMKQRFNYYFKDEFTITRSKEYLVALQSIARSELSKLERKKNNKFFKYHLDEFEVKFYKMILQAKDVKTVVDWIDEVKKSGLAYQKTHRVKFRLK
jgi:hypothetical protein